MQIQFKNYRCLRDARLRLSPLTVIVGPNASGKSTILRALDPQLAVHEGDLWQKRSADASIDRRRLADNAIWSSLLGRRPGSNGQNPYVYQLARFDPVVLRQENQTRDIGRLANDGSQLVNLFDNLKREQQQALAEEFCRVVPVFRDVEARGSRNADGQKRLLFQDRWNPDAWYEAHEVSDGSMLMLAYIALQHQQQPPYVLAVEEPERGLHPYLVEQLVTLLRELAEGKRGRSPMKVVLATHSPALLEYTRPEEVRFLDRDKQEGSVTIREAPVDQADWKQAFDAYDRSLAGAWLSGALGGVPGD